MAITAHTGEIYLLKGTPFNPNYDYSIAFSSLSAQQSYMQSKVDVTLPAQNYVKTESGKIRVDKQEEHIRDCNYLMWKTPSIGSDPAAPSYTWMYAFITNIDYISNNVSEISYQIDVLQTYALFNVTFQKCWISRRHYEGATTNPWCNIEPEAIPIGTQLLTHQTALSQPLNDVLVFSSEFIDPYEVYDADTIAREWFASKHCGLYQTVYVEVLTAADFATFMVYLAQHPNKADSIISMTVIPSGTLKARGLSDGSNWNYLLADDSNWDHNNGSISIDFWRNGMDGIAYNDIVNKKLFTYPYNHLLVTDGRTEIAMEFEKIDTSYESTNARLTYREVLSVDPHPEYMFIFKNYATLDGTMNLPASITLSDLQRLGWTTDSFKDWLANNGISGAVSIIGSAITGAVAGLAVGNPIGGALVGGGMKAVSLAGSGAQAAIRPDKTNGTISSSALQSINNYGVYAFRKSLCADDVRRVDNYFTRFGYACNRIENPSTAADRSPDKIKFTVRGITGNVERNMYYVQTDGCIVTGNCASEYCRLIEQIFDNGITWWQPGHVGEYN